MSDKIKCPNCKSEIDSNFVFCPSCGQSIRSEDLTKEFEFGFMSYNKDVEKKVNLWLKENKNVLIKSIKVNTRMNNLFIIWETVPTRIIFEYETVNTTIEYQYLYFKSMSLLGHSYSKVTKQFETWVKKNPKAKILWHNEYGHQSRSGNTQLMLALARIN